jgi:hypothetical protein
LYIFGPFTYFFNYYISRDLSAGEIDPHWSRLKGRTRAKGTIGQEVICKKCY